MNRFNTFKVACRVLAVMLMFFIASCDKEQEIDFGPEVTPGPSIPEEIVLKDLTEEQDYGLKVLSLDETGDMNVTSTLAGAIQVGDYLVSGPTDVAPYGYLVRVTDVQVTETRGVFDDLYDYLISLKTTIANLNEVIKDLDLEKKWEIPFEDIEIDDITDPEGNSISFTKEGKEWKILNKDIEIGPFAIAPRLSLKPKNMAFYFSIKDSEFEKVGMDLDWDIKAAAGVSVGTKEKFSKTVSLYHVFLKPITISIGPVPVVFTPLFQIYGKVDATGSAEASFVVFDSTFEMHYGGYCDFKDNKTLHPTPGHSKTFECTVHDELHNEYGDFSQFSKSSLLDFKLNSFKLHGDVSFTLGTSISAGLYGCNYINRVDFFSKKLDFLADMLSIDLWAEAKATLGANYGLDHIRDIFAMPDDDCTFKSDFSVNLQLFARIWNPFKQEFKGFEPKFELFKTPLVKEKTLVTLFYSDFTGLDITPSSNSAKFSVTKHRPLFGYTLFPETEYGFILHKEDARSYGSVFAANSITNYINLRNTNDSARQMLNHFDLSTDFPYSKLEKNTTYTLYPYSKIDFQGSPFYIYRPGKRFEFSQDGTMSFKNLADVPGEDL